MYSLLTPAHLDPLEVVVTLVVGEAVGPLPLGAEVPVEAEALGPASPLLLVTEVTQPPQGGLLAADLLKASEAVLGLLLLLTDQAPLHHRGHGLPPLSLITTLSLSQHSDTAPISSGSNWSLLSSDVSVTNVTTN